MKPSGSSITEQELQTLVVGGMYLLEGTDICEAIFYLTFVDYLHPKERRRFPKGDRKALWK